MKNIWAVGRNYEDHAKEMGVSTSVKSEPMIFLKAASSAVPNGNEVPLPNWSKDVHHEIEVAIRIGRSSRGELSVHAFTIALDLTARDFQAQLKKNGQPWTLAKSFKNACPLGDWISADKLGRNGAEVLAGLENLEFVLKVNNEQRQHGFTKDMVHNTQTLLSYIAERFPVEDGDLLLTGTPSGVGPLKPGDLAEAEIVGFTKANWKFV